MKLLSLREGMGCQDDSIFLSKVEFGNYRLAIKLCSMILHFLEMLNYQQVFVVNLLLICCIAALSYEIEHAHRPHKRKHPRNILVILADDLGYGDTSVAPFTGSGILTPELELMAARGTVMTNFHTAAATCTPTRISILTGMYPWRVGVKAVYEYGEKGKSNRDDWLPQLPTVATAFRDANYTTYHSGKWHVGGMRNDDLDLRRLPPALPGESDVGKKRCPHPGPNQQGFDHYVSVLDGPGAPRQNYLQVQDQLYSHGCNHLLYNDEAITPTTFNTSITGFLTYCEATHAMRMMNESVSQNKPFYMHVWFHAPHGPWQEIASANIYEDQRMPKNKDSVPLCTQNANGKQIPRFCAQVSKGGRHIIDRGMSRFTKYRTMVTDMDRQVGRMLNNLRALGIDRDTLVVFLSDNGPEDGAGGAGGLRGNKRWIYEGGIRVPAIFQWIGTIPQGVKLNTFAVSTDLYPTFLDAAGIKAPTTARLDGMSLLPLLKGKARGEYTRSLTERVTMWHNDYEGPRRSALWTYDYKLFLDDKEQPMEMYDMLSDPHERNNLLASIPPPLLAAIAEASRRDSLSVRGFAPVPLTEHSLLHDRGNQSIHWTILLHTYRALYDFATFGDEAYRMYFQANPGRVYPMSISSDIRHAIGNPYRKVPKAVDEANKKTMLTTGSCGASTPCTCETKSGEAVPSMPFERVAQEHHYINPHRFFNGSQLMHVGEL